MIDWALEGYGNLMTFATVILTAGSFIGAILMWLYNLKLSKSSELRNENSKLKDENQKLIQENKYMKKQIQDYEDISKIEDQIVRAKDGDYLYWEQKDMKICPKCWYDEKKTILINTLPNGYFECPKCHNKGVHNHQQRSAYALNQKKKSTARIISRGIDL